MELPDYNTQKESPFSAMNLVVYKSGKVPAAFVSEGSAESLFRRGEIGFFLRTREGSDNSYVPFRFDVSILVAVAYSVEAWGKYRSTLSLDPKGPFTVFDDRGQKAAHGDYAFDDAGKVSIVGGVALPSARKQQYLIFQSSQDRPIIIRAGFSLLKAIELAVKKVYTNAGKKAPTLVWPSMLCRAGSRWAFHQKVGNDGVPAFVAIDKDGNRYSGKGDAYYMPHFIAEYVGDKVQSVEHVYDNIKGLFA